MKPLYVKAALPLIVGLVLAIFPAPAGLTAGAWLFFSLFAAVIVGLILEPIPAAAVGFIGVTLAVVLGLVDPDPAKSLAWGLAGFSNGTVWLIFAAFMFALGYQKTGLGKRLGLMLVRLLGKRTLGLGYAVAISDLILAPFMPSNTARSGGTLFPILRNIPGLYGSEPGPTSRKMGSYIMWTALAATCVTSSMFITALAPNLLALDAVTKATKLTISWADWTIGFLPAGILLLVGVPLLTYLLNPPEIKVSAEVPAWAGSELTKMGGISRNELIMAGLALLSLGLWIFGQSVINATTVALIVISLMLVTGVIVWEEILANKAAWNVLVGVATLVALADGTVFHGQSIGADGVSVGEWRDTVDVPRDDGKLRFLVRYDNRPGMWMFHCHILDHADAGMMDHRGLAVHEPLRANDVAAKCSTNRLVAQADTEDRHTSGELADRLDGDPGFFWRARTWRNDDPVWPEVFNLLQGDLVVPIHAHIFTQLTQILHQVVGEGIVIVDHQEHDATPACSANSMAFIMARALLQVSSYSCSGFESATIPAPA